MRKIEPNVGQLLPAPEKEAERIKGNWTESALRVLEERYLLRDEKGTVIETPEELCLRVAKAVAEAETNYGGEPEDYVDDFYELMVTGKFLPNSPTLMNAGTGNAQALAACYVLPVEDSIEGIFDAVKWAAIIHQSGGGTGFAFSRLRPKGHQVKSTQGVASGPVSFLKVFDAATETIKQAGRRRGANMAVLRCDHPDILEFIDCKRTGGITNFNISVGITDSFMHALERETIYNLIDPSSGKQVGWLEARAVLQKIAEAAWATGDPGLVFLDRVNQSSANPTPDLEVIEATNPCGEEPLGPFDACNLGSINVSKFVKGRGVWDLTALGETVSLAVRFLDNVIDINPYPLSQIQDKVLSNRRIGLGIMGWADALSMMGIPYDDGGVIGVAEHLMDFIQSVAVRESEWLATWRGSFPNQPDSIYWEDQSRRNAALTTIAPTGTISIIAGCSSGIEPHYALSYEHRANGRVLSMINPVFSSQCFVKDWMELVDWAKEHGNIKDYPSESWGAIAPEADELKQRFKTAHEIAPIDHVRMQAAFQRHIDQGISKTINMPNSATVEDVKAAYLAAWELGCLGITVYRDGCKDVQVLNAGTQKEPNVGQYPTFNIFSRHESVVDDIIDETLAHKVIKQRPDVLRGATYRTEAPEGRLYVTINKDEEGPFEVFLNAGKPGSDIAALTDGLGRLASMVFRLPSEMSRDDRRREIVQHLSGISGSRVLGLGPSQVKSIPDALAQVLDRDWVPEITAAPRFPQEKVPTGNYCVECGSSSLVYEEGCKKCYSCGYSEC